MVHPKLYLEMGRRDVEKSKAEAVGYRARVEFFAAEGEKRRAEVETYKALPEPTAAQHCLSILRTSV
jgi:hypothetical protein